ncbi:MAG: CHASE2 domain-containing protein [Bacteroidota bacterium]
MKTHSKKKRNPRELLNQGGIILALALFIVLLTQDVFFTVTPLKKLEYSTLDMRFQRRGTTTIPPESLKVIILDISESSIKALPDRFPWPHWYYAHVLRNLKRAGALGVGIDVTFDQPDANNPKSDQEMIEAIRETKILALAGKTEIASEIYSIQEKDYGNIFYGADSSIGIVYVPHDEDGLLRRYTPIVATRNAGEMERQDRFPTLSFAVLNKVYHQPPSVTAEDLPGEFLYMGKHIPKADDATIYVNYYGPNNTFKHIPFSDVIDDSSFQTVDEKNIGADVNTFDDPDIPGYLQSGYFKNKIVLIGSTMPEDHDLFPVPIGLGKRVGDNLMYGVEIHANVIENVLDNNFLTREPKWIDTVFIFLLTGLTFSVVSIIKHAKMRYHAINEIIGVGFVFAEWGAIIYVSLHLFEGSNYVTIVTNPMYAVGLGYLGATVYNYLIERRQKNLIKNMFTQYLNPAVVNQLVENPDSLRLGGERKKLTVFFSDIASFTSLSEKLSPENLVALLNEYLSAMTEIIFAHGGTLDKFEGDAIMAFWGAPIEQPDHALRACKASLKMQEELVLIRERWKKEGKPDLYVRIGLNTGDMLVGNMGGAGRFDYTVIGDNVNLASRLEGANKQYKSSIMMGQATYEEIKSHVIARELDMLVVVGKTEPVKVYELFGLTENGIAPEVTKFLQLYHNGLQLHRQQKWEEAISSFEQSLTLRPGDYPAQIYIERSRLYQMAPPPENWDGVFKLTSK